MHSVRGIWINLKSSLWFLPSLCIIAAIGLAVGLVEVDVRVGGGLAQAWPRFFGLSANGSRNILATIAQSVVTILGVSFSITIVALSLAANQYTSRVLRNFMRDRGNQTVLGSLVGIFVYCVIVLRTIHGGERPFIPAISMMAALVLAVVAMGLFVYFIHHVATNIQVASIICSIATETRDAIHELFPQVVTEDESECEFTPEEERLLARMKWQAVPALETGYLQTVARAALVAFARKHQTVVRMECDVGNFVLETRPLVSLGLEHAPSLKVVRQLNRLFTLEPYRSIDQDPAYGVRQMVDIAVKALSPAVNNPATAINCLDYLASVLSLLLTRQIPRRCQYEDGQLRLVGRRPSLELFVNLAFSEIRQNSGSQVAVVQSLLTALERVAQTRPLPPERLKLLRTHAQLTVQTAEQNIRFTPDLEKVRAQAAKLPALISR